MVNRFSLLTIVVVVLVSPLHQSGGWVQGIGDVTTQENGGASPPSSPPPDVFANFIAPMIKNRMMTTGNKTEDEAESIMNLITTRMNASDSKTSNASPGNPFVSGNFFQNYITPVIRQGMVTSGNKTGEEADALINIISKAVETKSKIQAAVKGTFSSSGSTSDATSVKPASPSSFFQEYISPIIRIGIVSSGNKTESEADSILNTISTAIASRPAKMSSEGNDDDADDDDKALLIATPSFETTAFFNNFLSPMIKYGMMEHGNKTETEADAIMGIITTSIAKRQVNESVVAPILNPSGEKEPEKPASFFQNFVAPFIRNNMINSQNKTAAEADAIMNIISTSMAMNKNTSTTTALPTPGSGSFFSNYIAPLIRSGMINSGNKTATEADKIIETITSAIKTRTAPTSSSPISPSIPFPFFGQGQGTGETTTTGNFFEDNIAPIVRYHMITTGNKTENEADAILSIISTSIKEKETDEPTNGKVKEEGETVVSDIVPDGKGGKNVTFFEQFVLPLIRYSIINSGNKTAEEANAILNIISPTASKTSTNDIAPPKPGSFFEDFIAPIIRNRIMGEGTKNASEVDAIINSIIIAEKEKEAAAMVDEVDTTDGNGMEDVSGNVTEKFIDGILIPGMVETIDEVSKTPDATKTEAKVGPDTSQVAEASGKAVADIVDDFVEAIENEDSSDSNEESKESSEEDDSSSEASKDSEDSNSSKESSVSEDSEDSSSSSMSEDSQASKSSKDSGETAKTGTNAAVETFVTKYLGPVLDEKITNLQTLATFFSNPQVIDKLRESLKNKITTMNAESDPLGNEDDDDENTEKSDKSPALDPVSWFIEKLVIPELHQKAETLNNVAHRITSLQQNKTLSGAIYKFISERINRGSKYFGEEEEQTQTDTATSGDAKQFITEIFVPKIKMAVQRFRNMTSSKSSNMGQNVIGGQVKAAINQILATKLMFSSDEKSESELMPPQFPDSSDLMTPKTSPNDESFGGLVGEIVASAIKKSGDRLKVLANKMSNPTVANNIANVLTTKINSVIEFQKKQQLCPDGSCSESASSSGLVGSVESSDNWNAEEIITQIVQLKFRISDDRRKCDELDRLMAGKSMFRDNLELVSQKLDLVKDIKNCSITIGQLFITLRKETFSKRQIPSPSKAVNNSTPSPYVELQRDIIQITQTKENLANYRQKLNEMNQKLDTPYYSPNRMELVSEKLKLVWSLKGEGMKLGQLYEKARQDQIAVDNVEKKEKVLELEPTTDVFETSFTDEEMAKYSGLLNELSFAQKPSSGPSDENDRSMAMPFLVCGLALAAIAMATVGALVIRRRRGRQRLYTYIPSERSVDSRSFLAEKETYGSFK